MNEAIYTQNVYHIHQKFWQILGRTFVIADQRGQPLAWAYQSGLKLKARVTLYTSKPASIPLLTISPQQISQQPHDHDVTDAQTNKKMAIFRCSSVRSFKLFTHNAWQILSPDHDVIGQITEAGTFSMLGNLTGGLPNLLLPKSFHGTINEEPVFKVKRSLNPILIRHQLLISTPPENLLTRKLSLAAALVVCTDLLE